MTVRPVDSLTMVPRLNEAGRMVHQQEQEPLAFQQVLGVQVQDKAQRAQTRVKKKEEAQQAKITRERQGEKRGRGESQAGRRQPPSQPQGDDRSAARTRSGHLDVKV